MRRLPVLLIPGLVLFTACPSDDGGSGFTTNITETSTDDEVGETTDTETDTGESESTEDTETDTTEESTEESTEDTDTDTETDTSDDGPLCGNGVVDDGEECDVGMETHFCDGDCTFAVCGDGYWNMAGDEQCDDGNSENNDGCVGACIAAACGDNYVYEGVEECDDGDEDDNDDCTNSCTMAFCGDGIVHNQDEECDDGNDVDTDACTAQCTDSFCGDGVLWEGMETCDDGNMEDTDACPTSCEPAFCGDGFVYEGVEECDDGNDVDDDFCANDCTSTGNGVIYTADFTQGQNSPAQCSDWQDFQTTLQGLGPFTTVIIRGSNDPQGAVCTGPTADTICQALANSQTIANVACDGRTWNVGPCGAGTEINAQGNGDCQCTNPGYTVRPCINNLNWGGINTATCNAPTQTLEVICG